MKIGSPLPRKKARIEIIPLIDIMFFLLAAFMLASFSLIRLHAIRMELPSAQTGTAIGEAEMVNISVDRAGEISVEGETMHVVELRLFLSNRFQANTNVTVCISGDEAATHGAVVRVLDVARRTGIQKVSFAIAPQE